SSPSINSMMRAAVCSQTSPKLATASAMPRWPVNTFDPPTSPRVLKVTSGSYRSSGPASPVSLTWAITRRTTSTFSCDIALLLCQDRLWSRHLDLLQIGRDRDHSLRRGRAQGAPDDADEMAL